MIALVLAAALAGSASGAQGANLYAERCSSCHGAALQGSPNGPPLDGKSAADVDFMLATGRMPASVPWEQEMRKQPAFTPEQIDALVAYVVQAGHGDARLPAISGGDVRRGRQLFAENCAHCHGVTAHGASVGYQNYAPSLMESTSREVAEAVRVGPGVMPAFGPDVLAPGSVADVARYVRYLQTDTANPGGLALANVGPVAEGFVGWAFGLGLLVWLVRRIGTTE